jgi:tRNA(fMet)-specific endonuclease VapC
VEPALLGIVLDSSVLIAAERRNISAAEAVDGVQRVLGDVPVVVSAVTIAEIGHGIYRAQDDAIRARRRAFLDDIKATVILHPFTQVTAEIAARVGGEQAARGDNLPMMDLLIGACALELGYAIGTGNARDFYRIPGLHVISL